MQKMQELEYTVSFTTPAFLGNAEQQAQWRTPPFKALLRQWWRIAAAPQFNYDHAALREAEGKLFGHAWLENDKDKRGQKVAARKGKILLRLNQWSKGALSNILGSGKVHHPEVGAGMDIQANVYLGYGPVNARNSAIEAEEQIAKLWIGLRNNTESEVKILKQATHLMGKLGTVGSRSRNGWGSLQLGDGGLPSARELQPFTLPFRQCLQRDWAHAIGADDAGILTWKTTPQNSWRDAMRELARAKIAFRTHFKFTTGNNSNIVESRHILAYPVTSHSVKLWGNQGRLGNQVRFKVVKQAEKYIGLITHLPCKLPAELANKLHQTPDEPGIWQQVHQVLDKHPGLSRLQ